MITKIVKRDGREVPFNIEKIINAIFKAAQAAGGNDYKESEELAVQVCDYVEKTNDGKTPTVEQVQDAVEKILVEKGTPKPPKHISYIGRTAPASGK